MNQPFYFPDGRLAKEADDLFELCQQYPDDATNYLVKGDLENWLAYIGSYELAECATNARQIESSDRQKLEEFLNRFRSVTSAQAIPAAVTETQIEDNLTAPPTSPTPDVPQEEPQESASVATDLPMSATLTETTEVPQEESSPEPTTATPPAVAAESLRSANTEDSKTESSPSESETNSEEKPSFFQVIAKFIVKILYRNKA